MAQILCGNVVFEMKTQGANKDRKQAEQPKVFPDLVMPAVLPDGNGSFMPCPELLTEDEAVCYLRLDIDDSSNPEQTLKYYRDKGELVAIRVGRKNRYRRQDLVNFLAHKSQIKQGRLAES
jgi:hypothetical protein